MKLMLVFAFMALVTTLNPQCGDSGPGNGTQALDTCLCEYDQVINRNIFPDYSTQYLNDAFSPGKIYFSVNFNDLYISPTPNPLTGANVDSFVRAHALWSDDELTKQIYLASVNRFDTYGVLGISTETAPPHHAWSMIFWDNITEVADDHQELENRKLELRQENVIHELGHGRGHLTHLCNGFAVDTNHDDPSPSSTCVMAANVADVPCAEDGVDESPLEDKAFCDKCVNNLLNRKW